MNPPKKIFGCEADKQDGIAFFLNLYAGVPRAKDLYCKDPISFASREEFVACVRERGGDLYVWEQDRVSFSGPYDPKLLHLYARILKPEDYYRASGMFDLMCGSLAEFPSDSEVDSDSDADSTSSKKRKRA